MLCEPRWGRVLGRGNGDDGVLGSLGDDLEGGDIGASWGHLGLGVCWWFWDGLGGLLEQQSVRHASSYREICIIENVDRSR